MIVKLFRTFLSIVALLIVVAGLAMSCLYIFMNPNKLKPIIASAVLQKTGYHLKIHGPIAWSFYPEFVIKLQRVDVSIPNQSESFLELQNVVITSRLTQLWDDKFYRGRIAARRASFDGIVATNLNFDILWQKNLLTVPLLTAELFEGTVDGSVQGNALLSINPGWNAELRLNNVNLQQFLAAITHSDSNACPSGKGEIRVHLASVGRTHTDIVKHFFASSEFNFSNGSIEGIDFNYLLRTADALAKKQSVTPFISNSETTYDSLAATVVLNNGVLTMNDLVLSAPTFIVKGNGNMTTPAQIIDLHLHLSSQQALKAPWEVPIRITGDYHHPDIRLDTNDIEKQLARDEVKPELAEIKDKAREEVEKHIHGKAGVLLKNLLSH